MKLFLVGHDYKYAAEQILLTLFPGQRPEYTEQDGKGDFARISLCEGQRYTTAVCLLRLDGQRYIGRAAVINSALNGQEVTDRLLQRAVKISFYRSALRSGLKAPAWGALTGVRPGKLMMAALLRGLSEKRTITDFCREFCVSRSSALLCLETAKAAAEAAKELGPQDICLYVGIPFCPSRCSYCSFVSASTEKSAALIEPYLSCLFRELDATAEIIRELKLRVRAVYIGGGTPTTLDAMQLDALLGRLGSGFDLAASEITVEAGRPDTITAEKLETLKKHGVNRLSINPQTMEDTVLEAIGRQHTAQDVIKSFGLCRETGGFEINMDLIAGLPSDSLKGFNRTVDTVLELFPENITLHTLSLKKGSALWINGAKLPEAEAVSEMLEYARKRFAWGGYSPYYLYRQKFMSGGFENVGWTRKGFQNLYNICIMEELCGIISVGAGASTKLVSEHGRLTRMFNPKYPREYIDRIEKILSGKQKIGEFYSGL